MSQTLAEYKGYNGSVHYSAEDRVMHGRLVGIRDAITFEGGNVLELETNFRSAVDEYLRFCKAQKKSPDSPFRGTFNVRVGPELHKRAALFAEENGEKLNKVVHDALENYLTHAS